MQKAAIAQPDDKAVAVARDVYGAARPLRLILFGSRARGDHRPDSDIDLLLITPQPPAPELRAKATAAASQSAASQYREPVPVQLVWKTAAEYDQMRRTVNHLVARAIDEGVFMSQNPEDDADGQNSPSYEWTQTQERVRHAEIHLDGFITMAELGKNDRLIGKNAQEAMEHALKAVISAANARYDRTHSLNHLLGQARAAAPEFQFHPKSNYSVLMQYCGNEDYYEPQEPLTNSLTYREDVESDVRTLLDWVVQKGQG